MEELIEDVLSRLSCNPNDSYAVLSSAVAQLSTGLRNDGHLQNLVEYVFKKCIQRSDYHAVGAQLCTYLSANLMLDESIKTTFRGAFLCRCQVMYSSRNEYVETYAKRKELISFTDFMAQILLHMRLPDGSVMDPFPEVVIKLLTALMDAISEDTIQCINRVLRVTGPLLEHHEKQRNEFSSLFNSIRDTYVENVLKPQQQKILLQLILLKSLNWIPNEICSDFVDQE